MIVAQMSKKLSLYAHIQYHCSETTRRALLAFRNKAPPLAMSLQINIRSELPRLRRTHVKRDLRCPGERPPYLDERLRQIRLAQGDLVRLSWPISFDTD